MADLSFQERPGENIGPRIMGFLQSCVEHDYIPQLHEILRFIPEVHRLIQSGTKEPIEFETEEFSWEYHNEGLKWISDSVKLFLLYAPDEDETVLITSPNMSVKIQYQYGNIVDFDIESLSNLSLEFRPDGHPDTKPYHRRYEYGGDGILNEEFLLKLKNSTSIWNSPPGTVNKETWEGDSTRVIRDSIYWRDHCVECSCQGLYTGTLIDSNVKVTLVEEVCIRFLSGSRLILHRDGGPALIQMRNLLTHTSLTWLNLIYHLNEKYSSGLPYQAEQVVPEWYYQGKRLHPDRVSHWMTENGLTYSERIDMPIENLDQGARLSFLTDVVRWT